ncbi:MAG: cupin domain-containing protein [Candidatus Lambdaproteobacteria bacterium]|nr:cupin domain-containing protein [Candidatus Lambdaproteobacteria bacterium]
MSASDNTATPHLLRAEAIARMPEQVQRHPLNDRAVRHTRSLSDALGLQRLGLHLVRVEPGDETTEYHFHHLDEEFLYILSGRGIAEIGEAQHEVGPGDCMGFTAPSLPHVMRNPFDEPLVYFMGGQRSAFDITDYPRRRKRLFRHGRSLQVVDIDAIDTL